MGRRPKAAPPKREPMPVFDLTQEDMLSPSEFDIEEFLEEWAPGSSVVEIYEMARDGTRPHLERVDIAILKEDLYGYLREHHGAGKFLLQFKDAGRHIRKALVVYVGGPKKDHTGPIQPAGESFHEKLILALIASGNNRGAAPLDVGALMTGLGAMLAALKPNAPPVDPSAMLQAVTATFANLRAGAGPDDWMDKAQKMIAMAKDLSPNGNGEGSDSWAGIAREVITAGAAALQNFKQPNPPVDNRPAIPPGAVPIQGRVMDLPAQYPAGGRVEALPTDQPKDPEDILKEWLTAQLAFLKTKARSGKDPGFWVEYTLENAEEPGNAAILEAMRRGATFPHLLTFDPEIGKDPVLANWFQRFYEELHAALNEDMDSDRPGGDTPNPGGNGNPGTE